MFLSGSWASDGDSDAFNQIFYTTSTNGKVWTVPKVVVSTDYTFSASAAQDKALAEGKDEPLGISAYYCGRAYGPAVVQNPNGSLTMVLSGYRIPKPITTAGTKLGTNPAAQYTVGAKDLALYRNILTVHLTSATTPGVATTTSVESSDAGSGLVGAPVTYTAVVAPVAPGTGTPTGTVTFADGNGPIPGCSSRSLSGGSPDTATCITTHEHPAGADEITATYSSDANYAESSGTTSENVLEEPAITSAASTTFTEGAEGSFRVTANGTPAPTVSESGTLPKGVSFNEGTDTLSGTPTQDGEFEITFEVANGVGSNAVQPFTLTVDAAPAITSADEATFTEGAAGSFTVSASGNPTPLIDWTAGTLPEGVEFNPLTNALSGTPTQEGVYHITFEATNGVGSNAVQHFTLTVDAPPAITSADEATLTDHSVSSFTVTATGTPAPTITKWGTLPEGVSFSNGVLSGTPTQTGTFEIAFTAANGVGVGSIQLFKLTVVGLHITTSSLPKATSGVPFGKQLEAIGGLTPLKWAKVSGKLPLGIKLSTAGLLSGKVALKKYAPGTSFSFTVKVTDSTKKVHQTAMASLTLTIE